MNISAKLALLAAVVGVAVVGIVLLRAGGEVGQSSPPSSQAPVASPMARTSSPAVVPPSSTASSAATLGGERIGAWPALGAPAGNGLIAYSSDGDIFVGDPVAGTSTAIVTGPSNDTRPIFSPDGLRISFLRAESAQDATIVVVRPDGSDERIVAAEGSTTDFPAFAWTPDSTSVVVSVNGFSLVDASGVAEPHSITPPLHPPWGYTYFSIHDPVAPMLRPPKGDQIVGEVDGLIFVTDIDGTTVEGFVPPTLTEFEPYFIDRLAWSRDGSMISFHAYSDARSVPFENFGLFMMNADGSELRRFETEFLDRAWSPDSSKIALEKPVAVSGSAGSVIAILDVETGAERVLEATSAVEKEMADRARDPDAFRTYSIRTGHRYAYEGWSWSPDGRSILVLERHGTRPFFVDIETGQVTELSWEVDGAPSWQRVPIE